jgi:integrase
VAVELGKEIERLLERVRAGEVSVATRPECDVTVETVMRAYLSAVLLPDAKPRTARRYRGLVERICSVLGGRPAMSLTDDTPEEYRRARVGSTGKRGRIVGEGSMRVELPTLFAALNWAAGKRREYRVRLIPENPLSSAGPLVEAEPSELYLEERDFQRLWLAAGSPLNLMLPVYYDMGFRKDELRCLRKDRLDFEAGCVRLKKEDTKKRRARPVPMATKRATRALRILSSLSPTSSEWVCANPKDPMRPVPEGTLDNWVEAARGKAGLAIVQGESLSLHKLRHACGMNWMVRGIPYPTTCLALGWSRGKRGQGDAMVVAHDDSRTANGVYLNKMSSSMVALIRQRMEAGIAADMARPPNLDPDDLI